MAQKKDISDRDDIIEMRRLFWLKYYKQITQEELERETARICDRQMSLVEREEYSYGNQNRH